MLEPWGFGLTSSSGGSGWMVKSQHRLSLELFVRGDGGQTLVGSWK